MLGIRTVAAVLRPYPPLLHVYAQPSLEMPKISYLREAIDYILITFSYCDLA